MRRGIAGLALLGAMIFEASAAEFAVVARIRVEGDVLPASPSTANCETRCETTDRCVAYRLSKDGICELFSSVRETVPDAKWRSGLRLRASAGNSPGGASR
jgi:hypothetical protein